MTQDLAFYIAIDPSLPRQLTSPAVAFGDFDPSHPGVVVYSKEGVSQLSRFYVDLICGRPLPVQFVARELDIGTLVAITLFFDRDLALNPKVPGFISEIEVATALQWAGLAHIDRDLARFLPFVDEFLLSKGKQSKKDLEEKLTSAIQWVREYILEGKLPSIPEEPAPPRVVDAGTNGFVVAEAQNNNRLFWAMVDLYRAGFLRGVVFGPGGHVLAFRKSFHIRFDLETAAGQLNQAEAAMGLPEAWKVEKGLHLIGPPGGTDLPREALTEVFLRI